MLFLSGIIELNKSIALFPVVVLLLGYLYERFSLVRAFAVFGVLLFVFQLVSPLVSHARIYAAFVNERNLVIPVETRIEALMSYGDENQRLTDSQVQGGWSRISYVNSATFAISEYDVGRPGNTLRYLFIVWIPRAIYPDKPEITAVFREFNAAATGNDLSQSSPGIVAEGYWSYGWLGVLLFAMAVTMVSTYWSTYSIAVLHSEAWHLFFVVLLGMRTGIRLDGLFVTDVVGPIGFAVLGHVVLQLLNRLLIERQARTSAMVAATG
jgi:hypothetical protein